MRLAALLLCALLFASAHATAQQRPSGALTPHIESVLRSIKAADKGQLAVSEEDGRFLRVLVATRGAKSILEIGAASGYSGIWLGLGARETGGRVVAIEYDPQRAQEAAANVRSAPAWTTSCGWCMAMRLLRSRSCRERSTSSSSMRGSPTTGSFSTWCSRA